MKVYADSSFLVSLYTLDSNSMKAAQWIRRFEPLLWLTPLVELEIANALELRAFRKESSAREIRAAKAEFRDHIADGFFSLSIMPLTAFELAQRLSKKQSSASGTRTLDILHVASALLLRAEKFWSFDHRQLKLAQSEGLELQ